ncbi:MAG: glutathione peroxidase [Paracoccaceae bacterium]
MIDRRALVAALGLAPVVLPRLARAADAHDFAFEGIDGDRVDLATYAGRPVLVVNTASRCSFTYQYEQLQALYDRHRDAGLVVLGVPSQDFRQELGSEEAVKEFCAVNFAIDFPMTAITPVIGGDAHPFYAWAAREAGRPRWNFHKYLVGPDGRIAGAWGSTVEPTSAEIEDAVRAALAAG